MVGKGYILTGVIYFSSYLAIYKAYIFIYRPNHPFLFFSFLFFSFLFYSVRLAPSDGYILSQSHTTKVYECLLFLMIIIIIDFLGKRHATAYFHKHIFFTLELFANSPAGKANKQ